MKGRPARTESYSDAQWQKIKNSLTDAGVDAERVVVGWSSPRPLREHLCSLSIEYAIRARLHHSAKHMPKKLTRRQLKQEIAEFDIAIRVLRRSNMAICAEALEQKRAKLQDWPPRGYALMPAPNIPERQISKRFRSNAGQTYTDYWIELMRLWQEIVPNAARLPSRHKHLRNFLSAVSAPVFQQATTDAALRAFTDRHLPQTKLKTT